MNVRPTCSLQSRENFCFLLSETQAPGRPGNVNAMPLSITLHLKPRRLHSRLEEEHKNNSQKKILFCWENQTSQCENQLQSDLGNSKYFSHVTAAYGTMLLPVDVTVIVLADVILVLFGSIAYLYAFPVMEVTFKNSRLASVSLNQAAKEIKGVG